MRPFLIKVELIFPTREIKLSVRYMCHVNYLTVRGKQQILENRVGYSLRKNEVVKVFFFFDNCNRMIETVNYREIIHQYIVQYQL